MQQFFTLNGVKRDMTVLRPNVIQQFLDPRKLSSRYTPLKHGILIPEEMLLQKFVQLDAVIVQNKPKKINRKT